MAQTATTSLSSNLPGYLQDPLKDAIGSIEDWTNSDSNYVYGSKPGESIYTPLSDMQEESIANIDWLGNQDLGEMFGFNQGADWMTDYGSIGSERLIDEDGYLGAISGYMNPYLEQVLNPAIANMNDQMQKNLNQSGAEATMSGSFGGARHGIREGEIMRDTSRDIGDLTARTMMQGYDTAMGQRAADRAQRSEVGRDKAQAAAGLTGLGTDFYDLFSNVNDSVFNAGEVERNAEIERNDAIRAYQEAVKNKKYDDAMRIISAIQGVPYERSSTSTQTQESDDGMWQWLGAGLGALL